jgi:hypothetical protein
MYILPVITPRPIQNPAILFQPPDDVPNLRIGMVSGTPGVLRFPPANPP